MKTRKILPLIILVVLLSSTFASFASASDSHENFEKARTNLNTLYASLNRTKLKIVGSLHDSLKVNYSTEYNPDKGRFGSFNYSYSQDSLNSSLEVGDGVEENLFDAHDLLKKIKGKVSSYEYVKENYQPFYRMSVNLTGYTESHDNLVRNVTDVIRHFNNGSIEVNNTGHSFSEISSFNDASYNLRQMERYLEGIESSYVPLKDSIFDLELVEEQVQECNSLIKRYKQLLDLILEKYKDLPLSVTLYTPDLLHPGETYELEGFLVKGGEYIENTSIEIYIDGVKVEEVMTDEKGHYITEMKVPWDVNLGKKKYRVAAPSKEIRSDNHTVDIVRWPSDLTVQSDNDLYYNEIVNIHGSFSCSAPIDKSSIKLKTNFSKEVSIQSNGIFNLNLGSNNLPWGRNNLSFEYQGNDTITSSSDTVLIKRNIPTILKLKPEVKGKRDMEKPLPLEGFLLNKTSKKGIEDLRIKLLIDGKMVKEINTTKNGSYSLELDVVSLNLKEGNHELKAVFNETKKYRKSESEEIGLYIGDDGYIIGEEDDDKIFGIFDLEDIIVLIFVMVMSIIAGMVYNYLKKHEIHTGKDESVEDEDLYEGSEEPVLTRAENKDEISYIYGQLINRIQERGIVDIKKGKTHRDLLSDISHKIGLEDELQKITDIFEKAYFTQRTISSSELEVFNNSLTKVKDEVLW